MARRIGAPRPWEIPPCTQSAFDPSCTSRWASPSPPWPPGRCRPWQASAAVSADESTFVSVSPVRILDTREEIGLPGPFVSPVPQDLKVTGPIPTKVGTTVVVPDGATGVVLNVTVVGPTADGFLSIRPADAPGAPTTSNLNFSAGDIIPNSVTVQVPTSGADAGKIEITYNAFEQAGPTTEILVDLVGYTKNAGLASLQTQVNELQAAFAVATAPGAVGSDEIAPNAVTASELADNSVETRHVLNGSLQGDDLAVGAVGLDEMNARIVEEASVTFVGSVPAGDCADDIPITPLQAAGARIGTRALVLVSGLATPAVNPGFAVIGGAVSTVVGTVNVKICNDGPAGDPNDMVVTFIALAP